jgi:hypothetical protein
MPEFPTEPLISKLSSWWVKERIFYIQNDNAYDSRLKGLMQRVNGVATQYLDSYLGGRRSCERNKENACNQKSWLIEAMRAVLG